MRARLLGGGGDGGGQEEGRGADHRVEARECPGQRVGIGGVDLAGRNTQLGGGGKLFEVMVDQRNGIIGRQAQKGRDHLTNLAGAKDANGPLNWGNLRLGISPRVSGAPSGRKIAM
jgi:hypothetical protein